MFVPSFVSICQRTAKLQSGAVMRWQQQVGTAGVKRRRNSPRALTIKIANFRYATPWGLAQLCGTFWETCSAHRGRDPARWRRLFRNVVTRRGVWVESVVWLGLCFLTFGCSSSSISCLHISPANGLSLKASDPMPVTTAPRNAKRSLSQPNLT